jgi:hypothetical protein
MKSKVIRTIGIQRAEETIGLVNLTYNILRYKQLIKLKGSLSKCMGKSYF